MKVACRRSRKPIRQRGSAYIVVLSVSVLLVVIGVAALQLARLQRQTLEERTRIDAARWCAEAGAELALLRMRQDSNWRHTLAQDTWLSEQALGQGTLRWKLVDEVDGDLSNNDSDPVRVVGWGQAGRASQKVSVEVAPADGKMRAVPGTWRWVID